MTDASRPDPQTIFFFGCDAALREHLQAQAAGHGIVLHRVQTVAGLMYAARTRTARVVILQADCLPRGRSVKALLDRLEADTGTRPQLICLRPHPGSRAGARRLPTQCSGAACRAAFASFCAPFDAPEIMARVTQALAGQVVRPQRVLVVDALAAEAQEIVATLSAAGLQVEKLTDPPAVLAALERRPADLILLDLNLPQDASQQLTAAIRDHDALFDVPIVFLSAQTATHHAGAVLRLGEDEYLARPVGGERLLEVVYACLARRRGSAPAAAVAAAGDYAGGLALQSRTLWIKRVDHVILAHPTPPVGQAVLAIRVDDSWVLGALDTAGRDGLQTQVFDLVHRLAGPVQRGACLDGDALCVWVRCESAAEILELAERIRVDAASLGLSLGLARVSLSIGIGTFTPPVDNALTLLSRAQAALEQARLAGGDRVQRQRDPERTARPDGDGDAVVLRLLRGALEGPGFALVYQPILSLHRSQHERYEVLLRLRTPFGEIMPPLSFLPVAARHGLLPALDRWVLGRSLATLRAERDAGRPTLLVIFQSGASLAAPGWLDWVRAEVLRLDLIRQRPVLEFNAPDIIENEDRARVLFPELGRLGIEVCLAGVTDREDVLGLIARRPIGTAKLARELIGRTEGARLRSLVEALHQRHARVIAAGIENPEAIGRVWSSGVDFIQGNFIQFPEDTLNFHFQEAVVQ